MSAKQFLFPITVNPQNGWKGNSIYKCFVESRHLKECSWYRTIKCLIVMSVAEQNSLEGLNSLHLPEGPCSLPGATLSSGIVWS